MDAQPTRKRDERMGELLRLEGLLTQEQIAATLMRQSIENELFGEALVHLGFVTERDVVRVISKQYSLPFIDIQSHVTSREAIEGLDPNLLWRYQVIPLDRIGSAATFVTSGPITDEMVSLLKEQTGSEVYLFIGTVSGVRQTLESQYPEESEAR